MVLHLQCSQTICIIKVKCHKDIQSLYSIYTKYLVSSKVSENDVNQNQIWFIVRGPPLASSLIRHIFATKQVFAHIGQHIEWYISQLVCKYLICDIFIWPVSWHVSMAPASQLKKKTDYISEQIYLTPSASIKQWLHNIANLQPLLLYILTFLHSCFQHSWCECQLCTSWCSYQTVALGTAVFANKDWCHKCTVSFKTCTMFIKWTVVDFSFIRRHPWGWGWLKIQRCMFWNNTNPHPIHQNPIQSCSFFGDLHHFSKVF